MGGGQLRPHSCCQGLLQRQYGLGEQNCIYFPQEWRQAGPNTIPTSACDRKERVSLGEVFTLMPLNNRKETHVEFVSVINQLTCRFSEKAGKRPNPSSQAVTKQPASLCHPNSTRQASAASEK